MAELLYQGHGSMRLTTGAGAVIYIDPFAGEGYDEPADLILVTHQHPDHNKTDLCAKKTGCTIISNKEALAGGEYKSFDEAGVHIEAVPACNSHHDIRECVGYIVTVDGVSVYFAGDTSKTDAMAGFAAKKLDWAILPCDGKFNMDMPEASECAGLIGAKHTIPVHLAPGKLFDRERAEMLDSPGRVIIEPGEKIKL